MADVTFFRITTRTVDYKAHALKANTRIIETRAGPEAESACGHVYNARVGTGRELESGTHLKRSWHYCGNCSRVITAVYDTDRGKQRRF